MFFPYYKLTLTLVTGVKLVKLFYCHEDASTAFTVVSHCCGFQPFREWHSDRYLLGAVRVLCPQGMSSEELARLIPTDHDAAPLVRGADPTAGRSEWDLDEVQLLELACCHGEESEVYERLTAPHLRELGRRWEERVAFEEPVPVGDLL